MKIYNEMDHARKMIISGLKKRGLFSDGVKTLSLDKINLYAQIVSRKETRIVEKNNAKEYEFKGGF